MHDWYWITTKKPRYHYHYEQKWLLRIFNVNENSKNSYYSGKGFHILTDNVWRDKVTIYKNNILKKQKASENEIESALVEETKKRYNVGTKVTYLDTQNYDEIKGFDGWSYCPKKDALFGTSVTEELSAAIYMKGVWADSTAWRIFIK